MPDPSVADPTDPVGWLLAEMIPFAFGLGPTLGAQCRQVRGGRTTASVSRIGVLGVHSTPGGWYCSIGSDDTPGVGVSGLGRHCVPGGSAGVRSRRIHRSMLSGSNVDQKVSFLAGRGGDAGDVGGEAAGGLPVAADEPVWSGSPAGGWALGTVVSGSVTAGSTS